MKGSCTNELGDELEQPLLEAMQHENKRFLFINRMCLFMIANVSNIGAVCKLNQ